MKTSDGQPSIMSAKVSDLVMSEICETQRIMANVETEDDFEEIREISPSRIRGYPGRDVNNRRTAVKHIG
jgi:hypothetical protein